jgi:hypothetical protein
MKQAFISADVFMVSSSQLSDLDINHKIMGTNQGADIYPSNAAT